jgi:uncharacterized protein YjiS (DUF1127 family)
MNTLTHKPLFSNPRPSINWTQSLNVLLHTALVWQQRASTRRALARLDSRLLDDIGVSAKNANAETHKPFWAA